jgi:hypothetical protein
MELVCHKRPQLPEAGASLPTVVLAFQSLSEGINFGLPEETVKINLEIRTKQANAFSPSRPTLTTSLCF